METDVELMLVIVTFGEEGTVHVVRIIIIVIPVARMKIVCTSLLN
jgi:hypothetical protein